jgi:AcrR family transcriptional regulator
VAAGLLTERGVAGVEFQDLARRAGVTRPTVYRAFPSRHALFAAILSDFVAELDRRYRLALITTLGAELPVVVRAFIEASCDTIELKGAGAWQLLDARGADPELARLGANLEERLLSPWLPRVAELTGLSELGALIEMRTLVAAGRAALDFWIEGRIERGAAAAQATRAVCALITSFAAPAGEPLDQFRSGARTPERARRSPRPVPQAKRPPAAPARASAARSKRSRG